jgi:transcriptional regulator with XRE-family HTH domain
MNLRVKEIAEAQGITMAMIARETGLARTTIQRYWKGYIQRPDNEVLRKLAAALKLSDWRELFGPDDADQA